MNAAAEQLQGIRVTHAMSRTVVTVSATSTMAAAARLLVQHNISGAPVVNELGQCVGVLSATNFVLRDQGQESCDSPSLLADEFALTSDGDARPFHIEHIAEDRVNQHMCCTLQSIESQRSLIDAARYMQGGHIHRLIVVDQHARPVGVVSSLDIVAALVKLADEPASGESIKA